MDTLITPRNIPTVFVIFGATGDLMSRKIVPSLFHLYKKDKLPKMFKIIGVSRRDWTSEKFKKYVYGVMDAHADEKKIKREDYSQFVNYFLYHQGDFDTKKSYSRLAQFLGRSDNEWKVCSNKLFYLAVPPEHYKTILKNLHESGLTIPCSPEEGYTRILVEKPFGKDLKTAEELDKLLGQLFKEEQLYRIDHYLAKEMLQNILSFRFSNDLFEKRWDKNSIEKIEIRLLENLGIENRGGYYDGIGALRDVGQNHLLQMLSIVTMDQPKNLQAENVRKKRSEILARLEIMNAEEIHARTYRAQYKGYKNEKGVKKNSTTETYFKVLTYINTARWRGVPIILEAGKKLPRKKEVIITFRHETPCLCPPGEHLKNRIVFSLEPREEIKVEFWVKKPGLEYSLQKQTLTYLYRDERRKAQYIEEYEKLLLDCILGSQLLFVGTDEVLSMWRFIDPIISAWNRDKTPLVSYYSNKNKVLLQSQKIENSRDTVNKNLGIVGLGKMGGNIARRLTEKGWLVTGFNRTYDDTKQFIHEGGQGASTIDELVSKLSPPRILLLSLPAGKATEEMIDALLGKLSSGDIIIDAANGYYKDSIKYAQKVVKTGADYADAGISGGPGGARSGACIMVGGKKEVFEKLEPLFYDMALDDGVQFFPGYGAGHFVKMIHNGIEYGMMQAIAEGFTLLKESDYKLDLSKVADIYNHGSVIESRLTGWLQQGLEIFGTNLKGVSGTVAHSGEGEWTVLTADEMGIKTKVIEDAVNFRIESEDNPSYTGKVLSALRNMFGGHSIK